MEVQGKVIDILDIQEGQGKNGTWRKKKFVIETADQYPKKIAIDLWGDKIDQFPLQAQASVNVHINVESREFKGNWYTDIKAWKIDMVGGASAPAASNEAPLPESSNAPFVFDEEDGDMPF